MPSDLPAAPVRDRRVRRTRSALLRATIALVAERADVSRQVVYQHFDDRDALLLEAALDLARRELLPGVADAGPDGSGRARTLAVTRHFAEHRRFYRALLTSSCAFALNKALTGLLLPVNRQAVAQLLGGALDAGTVDDLATFLTGGWAASVNAWVIEGDEPLDPDAFTERLRPLTSVLIAAMRDSTAITSDQVGRGPDPGPHADRAEP